MALLSNDKPFWFFPMKGIVGYMNFLQAKLLRNLVPHITIHILELHFHAKRYSIALILCNFAVLLCKYRYAKFFSHTKFNKPFSATFLCF